MHSKYFRYIQKLIKGHKKSNVWQERAITCLQLLHHEEEKLKCAVDIAKFAPVPWSSVMDPLVEMRVLPHALAKEIDDAYKMQMLKGLRTKYGWNPNTTETDSLKFVMRILKCDKETVVEDVVAFTKVDWNIKNYAYWYLVHELARKGHIDKSIRFLQSLNEDEMHDCAGRIARITTEMIEDQTRDPVGYDGLMELIKFVLDKNIDVESKERIKDLMNLQVLYRSEYKMNVEINTLNSPTKVEAELEKAIAKLLDILKKTESNLNSKMFSFVQLLSKALKVDKLKIVLKLAKRFKNVQFTAAIVKEYVDDDSIKSKDEYFIELAILLIVQQFKVATDSICQNDISSYAYPIASLCLQKVCKNLIRSLDLVEINHFIKIGANSFHLDQINSYLNSDSKADDEVTYFGTRNDFIGIDKIHIF